MTTITALMIAIMVLAEAASDIMVTRAMKQVGAITCFQPHILLKIANQVLRNAHFLGGIGLAALQFAVFLTLLAYVDLSIVIPASALIFVVGTLGAKLFLKEKITQQRWLGSCLICVGVALASVR